MKKLFLILVISAFIVSCGKKEETQTTMQENPQQMTQTQTQQQTDPSKTQTTEQPKEDVSKKDANIKEDEKKKDTEKKEDVKKKDDKQMTEKKDKEETPKEKIETKNTSDIDFSAIFAKRCAKCHGKDLKGKKDGGPDLTTSKVKNTPDSKLIKIITDGVKAKNEDDEDMPAWKNKLSEDEIKAAVKFIKEN